MQGIRQVALVFVDAGRGARRLLEAGQAPVPVPLREQEGPEERLRRRVAGVHGEDLLEARPGLGETPGRNQRLRLEDGVVLRHEALRIGPVADSARRPDRSGHVAQAREAFPLLLVHRRRGRGVSAAPNRFRASSRRPLQAAASPVAAPAGFRVSPGSAARS